jgi:ArsR family transcriptional regulator
METCCSLDERMDAGLFRALSNPSRVAILWHLAHCPGEARSVGEIARVVPQDVSVVSRHLAALGASGVLDAEREGRSVRYRVRYEALADSLRQLAGAIERCAEGCACGCRSTRPTGEEVST